LEESSPGSPFARLGQQLWEQYGLTTQVRSACAQLQPDIASQAGPALGALQNLGVTTDAQSLCSAPAA
jgi:hypothetical protein